MHTKPSRTSRATPRYAGKSVTREEYLDLPEDGFQYDMIKGVLRLSSPSATFSHSEAFFEFGARLRDYLKLHPLGRAAVEVDVLLPDGGDVLRPDLSFVSRERENIILKHIHGTPDLICESLSDSTAKRDLGDFSLSAGAEAPAADRYLACGVREYWIVDSRDQSIRVWYNENGVWEKNEGALLESRLLPGFAIGAREFWGGA